MSTDNGNRSRTVAVWAAVFGGSFGLHRFYLHGWGDRWGWLDWPFALAGLWGAWRMHTYGQDDRLAWVLTPLLGLVIAIGMLSAIVYGLTPQEKWQARFDRGGHALSVPWLDIFGVIVALAIGTTALISSIAFGAQRYFESTLQPRSAAAVPARPQANR